MGPLRCFILKHNITQEILNNSERNQDRFTRKPGSTVKKTFLHTNVPQTGRLYLCIPVMFGSLFILAAERGVWRQFKQLANAHRLNAPKGGKNSKKSEPHTGSFLSEVCFAFGGFFFFCRRGLQLISGCGHSFSTRCVPRSTVIVSASSYVRMKPLSVFGVFLRTGC